MKRLIDADALTDKVDKYIYRITRASKLKVGESAILSDIKAHIELSSTIDAVPVSFIEKKIESIRQYLSEHEGEEFMSGLISKAIAYEKLIEEWREENGQTD